jgi:hypothetical protein
MSMETHSGGCQCGAVRFRLTGTPGTSSVCYCRMCQKASAAHALALVSVGEAALEWTRGQPSWFYLYDTTLRDGGQTPGIDFSLEDKLSIIRLLDELGIDYVEGGYPGANPTDTALFAEPRTNEGVVRSLRHDQAGRALRRQRSRPAGLVQAKSTRCASLPRPGTTMCAWRSAAPTRKNLACITDSVKAALAAGKEAMVDCEHFFDGYKANPAYALACAKTAFEAGARWIVLCDTNGGTLPSEMERDRRRPLTPVPGDRLGIHAHNDTGRRWPIRWRPCAPACARSRARSTASASVAAMPTSSR